MLHIASCGFPQKDDVKSNVKRRRVRMTQQVVLSGGKDTTLLPCGDRLFKSLAGHGTPGLDLDKDERIAPLSYNIDFPAPTFEVLFEDLVTF